MFVVEFNIDLKEPYIYDMYSDHSYEPFTNYDMKKHQPLHIDFASFPPRSAESICNSLGLDPKQYEKKTFCLLDEYYFFRTILESEAQRPTVVLRDAENYRKVLTFSEFITLFAKTYKIIYHRWKAFDPCDPCDNNSIPVSMITMFRAHEPNLSFTFRDWLKRVL